MEHLPWGNPWENSSAWEGWCNWCLLYKEINIISRHYSERSSFLHGCQPVELHGYWLQEKKIECSINHHQRACSLLGDKSLCRSRVLKGLGFSRSLHRQVASYAHLHYLAPAGMRVQERTHAAYGCVHRERQVLSNIYAMLELPLVALWNFLGRRRTAS